MSCRALASFAALLALAACNGLGSVPACRPALWGYSIPNGASYAVVPSDTTPMGIKVDTTGQPVSLELVDRLTREVGDCLGKSIDPSAFTVKVPADWTMSCDGKQELLASEAPRQGCDAKELAQGCPCRWRAHVQCPSTIVTTPSLYLYKDALIRFITGDPHVWERESLARCAAPSVPPVSGMRR